MRSSESYKASDPANVPVPADAKPGTRVRCVASCGLLGGKVEAGKVYTFQRFRPDTDEMYVAEIRGASWLTSRFVLADPADEDPAWKKLQDQKVQYVMDALWVLAHGTLGELQAAAEASGCLPAGTISDGQPHRVECMEAVARRVFMVPAASFASGPPKTLSPGMPTARMFGDLMLWLDSHWMRPDRNSSYVRGWNAALHSVIGWVTTMVPAAARTSHNGTRPPPANPEENTPPQKSGAKSGATGRANLFHLYLAHQLAWAIYNRRGKPDDGYSCVAQELARDLLDRYTYAPSNSIIESALIDAIDRFCPQTPGDANAAVAKPQCVACGDAPATRGPFCEQCNMDPPPHSTPAEPAVENAQGELTRVLMKNPDPGQAMSQGLELLFIWSRNIALLPLEDWATAFDRAETLCPFTDPTLYQEYLASNKPEIIKSMIAAATRLKAEVLKHQAALAKLVENP